MARNEPHAMENPSWSELLSGIVNDAAQLFAQEVQLVKLEIVEDIRATKTFVVLLALGGFIAAMGAFMILLMVAYLLNETTVLPLWGSFGVVGGIALLVGLGFLLWANHKKSDVAFVPQRATEAIKEDIGWIRSSLKTWKSENGHARH
jgi:Putative Actinobacterial Holin-X, holin superfamily III